VIKIGGILENHSLTLYKMTTLKDEPGAAGKTLKLFSDNRINVEYITESSSIDGAAVMSVCVKSINEEKVDHLLEKNRNVRDALNIVKQHDVCLVGVYGPHFREKIGIASQFFSLLGEEGINILGISTSISSVCCIIKAKYAQKAKTAISKRFILP
jgi:aspartate kinase